MTDYVRVLDRLHQQQVDQAATERLDAVSQFAAVTGHDLNNSLTVIMGAAELVANAARSPQELERLSDQIRNACRQARALTKELIAIGRNPVSHSKVVDLGDQVAAMECRLRHALPPGVELALARGPGQSRISIDPDQLERLVLNLVLNAGHAMPEGGTLEIFTAAVDVTEDTSADHHGLTKGRYVMLFVRDTGIGMDEATRAHVFEPYFTTKSGDGTGLGLASAYGTVKQSAGEIFVISEVAVGTTFKIYFPRVIKSLQEAIEESRLRTADDLRRHELLLRIDSLCHREREVALLVLDGNSTKRVAQNLSISKRTVDFHKANILRKLQVDTIVELLATLAHDPALMARLRAS